MTSDTNSLEVDFTAEGTGLCETTLTLDTANTGVPKPLALLINCLQIRGFPLPPQIGSFWESALLMITVLEYKGTNQNQPKGKMHRMRSGRFPNAKLLCSQ